MFNWFKKDDPDEMWRVLKDDPDPVYIENIVRDAIDGKEPDPAAFSKYLRHKVREELKKKL